MKDIKDIKLEAKISGMILAAIDGIIAEDVMHRDVTDISEALAMNIIKLVREAE